MIDFGDATVDDPALDFAKIPNDCGGRFLCLVLAEYRGRVPPGGANYLMNQRGIGAGGLRRSRRGRAALSGPDVQKPGEVTGGTAVLGFPNRLDDQARVLDAEKYSARGRCIEWNVMVTPSRAEVKLIRRASKYAPLPISQ